MSVNLDDIVNYEEIKEEFDISEISIKNHLEQLEVKDVDDIGNDKVEIPEEKLNVDDESDEIIKNLLKRN